MKVIKIKSNKWNYDFITKRKYSDIKAFVIHNTGNVNDTAVNNGQYFKREEVGRSAHFFIDRDGYIVKSVNVCRIAWSVGIPKDGVIYNNRNTISIELCDIVDKDISEKQLEALKYLIKRIKKKCRNCNQIIRHYDISGKECPKRYIERSKWEKLRRGLIECL